MRYITLTSRSFGHKLFIVLYNSLTYTIRRLCGTWTADSKNSLQHNNDYNVSLTHSLKALYLLSSRQHGSRMERWPYLPDGILQLRFLCSIVHSASYHALSYSPLPILLFCCVRSVHRAAVLVSHIDPLVGSCPLSMPLHIIQIPCRGVPGGVLYNFDLARAHLIKLVLHGKERVYHQTAPLLPPSSQGWWLRRWLSRLPCEANCT